MKPNRSWPGVPKRYSFRLRSIVRQPKSMATVVVVLLVLGPGSSMPNAAAVISASVVSGAISEIAPTVVVLPTPNPPAIMILTGIGAVDSRERAKSMHHSQNGVGGQGGRR